MTRQTKEGAKKFCRGALVPYTGLVALAAAVLIWLMASAGASGQTTMMLGVDVSPGANHSSSIGAIETCVSRDLGDEFTIDIFVNNVIELTSWELRLDYDSDVVQVTDVDFNYFLVSTPPGGNVFPTLFESELPGRQFLAAAEFSGPPDSGSGVLARLSMAAVGEGVSEVSVVNDPAYFAPRLTNRSGAAVGDGDSDGHWDGSIVGGEIRVGKSCAADAPVVTPKPSLAPGTTPNPGPGDSNGSDGSGSATSAPVVIIPGGGTNSGEGGSANSDGDAGNGSGSDSDPGSTNGGGTDPGDDGSESGGDGDDEVEGGSSAVNAADDGDSSGGLTLVILALGAAALALGALVYALSHRLRS